jgi:ABC-2 type transport system permease protein
VRVCWLDGLAGSLAADLTQRRIVLEVAARLVAQAPTPPDQAAFGLAVAAYVSGDRDEAPTPSVQFVQAGDVEAVQQSNVQLPGYLTMFVFFVAGFAAAELIKERDNHTLDRLLAGGAGRGTILAGKWLGTVVRGLFQATVPWTTGVLIFQVDMGRAPLGTVLVSASWAILLASFARSERSAGSLAVLSSLVLAPLGGCWWPLFVMSPWMQKLAHITPRAWANDAFNRLLLFGAGTADVLPNLLALAGFALVFIAVGLVRVRVQA